MWPELLPERGFMLAGGQTQLLGPRSLCATRRRSINKRMWNTLRPKVSMAPRSWATGAVESCTTDVMTDGSKSGRLATLQQQEETALTVRPILHRDRPVNWPKAIPTPRARWRNGRVPGSPHTWAHGPCRPTLPSPAGPGSTGHSPPPARPVHAGIA